MPRTRILRASLLVAILSLLIGCNALRTESPTVTVGQTLATSEEETQRLIGFIVNDWLAREMKDGFIVRVYIKDKKISDYLSWSRDTVLHCWRKHLDVLNECTGSELFDRSKEVDAFHKYDYAVFAIVSVDEVENSASVRVDRRHHYGGAEGELIALRRVNGKWQKGKSQRLWVEVE